MSDDLLDLSVGTRRVKGATGTIFTCRRMTNDVAARYRAAERAADAVIADGSRRQARYERDEEIVDSEKWEQIEAQKCDALLGQLVPILLHEDGAEPTVERLRGEFAAADIGFVIHQVMRPTVPAWATTPSSESA